jgi:hypothetical protein
VRRATNRSQRLRRSRRRNRIVASVAALVGVVATAVVVSISPSAAAPPPPVGGYFALTQPGATFPTESACVERVKRSAWEPRPENATANAATPQQPVNLARSEDFTATWNSAYRPRVTGDFVGTTDEIIQWAACKWGWSDDLVRAQAVGESNWHQSALGDYEARTRGHCTPDFPTGSTCPTSFGLLQIKWYFHPIADVNAGSSWPHSTTSTAFNVDYALAEMRGCYDGLSTYLGNTRGDEWGCLGAWFSGDWHDDGAEAYIERVTANLAAKAWRTWPDRGAPPATAAPTTASPATAPAATNAPTTAAPGTTVPTTNATTTPTTTRTTTTSTVPDTDAATAKLREIRLELEAFCRSNGC